MPTVAYPVYRPRRGKLLISCATLAITVALTPQQAWAQAYQGMPTTTSGTVSYAIANRTQPAMASRTPRINSINHKMFEELSTIVDFVMIHPPFSFLEVRKPDRCERRGMQAPSRQPHRQRRA